MNTVAQGILRGKAPVSAAVYGRGSDGLAAVINRNGRPNFASTTQRRARVVGALSTADIARHRSHVISNGGDVWRERRGGIDGNGIVWRQAAGVESNRLRDREFRVVPSASALGMV